MERARRTLRAWILSGDLPPGQPVSQVQLARRLGVSRGPLREALRLLQREGLVHHEHNLRARVADVSVPDLDQLYAMRISLESLAVAISVPLLKAADLAQLDELLGAMNAFAQAGEVDAWEEPHREFHAMLVRLAGERFSRECAGLSDHSERYRRVYIARERHLWETGIREHQAIASAAKAGDVDRAAAATAAHLARTAVVVIGTMDPGYEPTAVRRALRAHRAVES
jgi:DNA-binding GntR family transcriptional regulator